MTSRPSIPSDAPPIVQLFKSVFTDSGGEAEGAMVGQLAQDLFETTADSDLYSFVADDEGQLFGSIIFSRVHFAAAVPAFLLSPVAVHSHHQGQGIGQALIRHGLNHLRDDGVRVVITYGDPRFYNKVGFCRLSPQILQPPYTLSQPEGWLGQSLNGTSVQQLSGRCKCVDAFRNPAYW